MKNANVEIYEMLDALSLPMATQRFMDLSKSPVFFASTFWTKGNSFLRGTFFSIRQIKSHMV